MKLLVLSPTFPPIRSGGADHAFRLCQHLAERGLEVAIVTSRIENVANDPRLTLFPVMQTWSWGEIPRLMRIIRRYRPDVVNIHFAAAIYGDQPMITFAPTFLKKLLGGVRVITHIEDPDAVSPDRLPLRARAQRRLAAYLAGPQEVTYGYGTILRDSDQIIVLSYAHQAVLAKEFSAVDEKCVIIPPPPLMRMCADTHTVARQRGRDLLGVDSDEFLLAYFGYLYPGKGVETLLYALKNLAGQASRVRLVLIGGTNEVLLKRLNRPNYALELKNLAKELGVAEKVIWTDYYPTQSELASIYLRAADASVLPFDDGVTLNRSSLAGVMAHGLPTITTKGKNLELPFRDGENVVLCEPKNPLALSSALNGVINNRHLRQRLSAGARDLASEWFSWDKAVERTIDAFRGTAQSTDALMSLNSFVRSSIDP